MFQILEFLLQLFMEWYLLLAYLIGSLIVTNHIERSWVLPNSENETGFENKLATTVLLW